jgi:hypothetical protein
VSHLQARNKDSKTGPKTNQYCAVRSINNEALSKSAALLRSPHQRCPGFLFAADANARCGGLNSDWVA